MVDDTNNGNETHIELNTTEIDEKRKLKVLFLTF